MRKIISFVHITLDGFVSGPNGALNWVTLNEEILQHVDKRIQQCNTSLYGRKTYELMESYWPKQGKDPKASQHDINHSRWYNNVPKVVLSKTLKQQELINTTVISDNLSERINEIKKQPGSEILLFGSPTATHSLIEQNLIDGYWMFVNPVILGQGVKLFSGVKGKTKLKLLNSKQFESGVIELNYSVDK